MDKALQSEAGSESSWARRQLWKRLDSAKCSSIVLQISFSKMCYYCYYIICCFT